MKRAIVNRTSFIPWLMRDIWYRINKYETKHTEIDTCYVMAYNYLI